MKDETPSVEFLLELFFVIMRMTEQHSLFLIKTSDSKMYDEV